MFGFILRGGAGLYFLWKGYRESDLVSATVGSLLLHNMIAEYITRPLSIPAPVPAPVENNNFALFEQPRSVFEWNSMHHIFTDEITEPTLSEYDYRSESETSSQK